MAKAPTQQFLEMEEIKEGVVILKNKSLRGVLMVSSQNFALKSEEEQQATIFQFQNFLNSLDFPVEIIIQSRVLNITGYLEKLKESLKIIGLLLMIMKTLFLLQKLQRNIVIIMTGKLVN